MINIKVFRWYDSKSIKGESRKYCDLNKYKNRAYQSLWDKPKVVLKRKIYSTVIIWKERFLINTLSFHQRKLEKEDQRKTKVSRIKEIRPDINEKENWNTIKNINKKPKAGSLRKINEINKLLAKLIKGKKGKKIWISKIKKNH